MVFRPGRRRESRTRIFVKRLLAATRTCHTERRKIALSIRKIRDSLNWLGRQDSNLRMAVPKTVTVRILELIRPTENRRFLRIP